MTTIEVLTAEQRAHPARARARRDARRQRGSVLSAAAMRPVTQRTVDICAAKRSFADASPLPFWLDSPQAPEPAPPFYGRDLWGRALALERLPAFTPARRAEQKPRELAPSLPLAVLYAAT